MILERIAQSTRLRVARDKARLGEAAVKRRAEALPEGDFPFRRALEAPGLSFICEVKKASPSKGVISPDFPYLEIAAAYGRGGAAAVSVLTEPEYFQGGAHILEEISRAVSLPLLRKDFILEPFQIYEAKCIGASAILLICALLSSDELRELTAQAHNLGLSVLTEAHDAAEVERALACGASILGINNRNLKDFSVDFENSRRLRALVPRDVLFVAESGIKTPEDARALRDAGADAALVGEALMRSGDPENALRLLREGAA